MPRMHQDVERIACDLPGRELPRIERSVDDQENDQDEYAAQNSMVGHLPVQVPGYAERFMSKLLEGKTAVIAGVANRWSLAFAIAESFAREGATIVLTYVNEKQKETVESMTGNIPIAKMLPCDVTKDEDLAALPESLRELGNPIDVLVHSLAFANREDL